MWRRQKTRIRAFVIALIAVILAAPIHARATVARKAVGHTKEGVPLESVMLENESGIRIRVLNLGGIVASIQLPDPKRPGEWIDVALGFDRAVEYQSAHPYFGALIGRYANRIARGRFEHAGRTYQLATNDGPNHLHGGNRGFDKAVWAMRPLEAAGESSVELRHTSPDGDEGYPGKVDVVVRYRLTDGDELWIEYEARADRPTPLNLTHHTYWNLAGHGAGSVLGHEVTIRAKRYTPVDENLIPTGELASVKDTPFDFRTPHRIGTRIDFAHEQLRRAGGYDHNFVIEGNAGTLRFAARVVEPASRRVLEVLTTEPGMQFYTGNFLGDGPKAKDGIVYEKRGGFCLEAQRFPDSPNQPTFPSVWLRPGQTYRQTTVYRFTRD